MRAKVYVRQTFGYTLDLVINGRALHRGVIHVYIACDSTLAVGYYSIPYILFFSVLSTHPAPTNDYSRFVLPLL